MAEEPEPQVKGARPARPGPRGRPESPRLFPRPLPNGRPPSPLPPDPVLQGALPTRADVWEPVCKTELYLTLTEGGPRRAGG